MSGQCKWGCGAFHAGPKYQRIDQCPLVEPCSECGAVVSYPKGICRSCRAAMEVNGGES